MPTTTLHLTLEQTVVERAQRWSELHGTSISALVTDFLSGLPLSDDADLANLPPITRRLYGCAAGGPDREGYRAYVMEKYGDGTRENPLPPLAVAPESTETRVRG